MLNLDASFLVVSCVALGSHSTLMIPLSLKSDDHFCPDYWRMSKTDGKSLYQLQTTNGYEAVHSIGWGLQKKCTASRWGQTKCPSIPLEILSAQHVLGQARPCQQWGCFSNPWIREAWRNWFQTGGHDPLLSHHPLRNIPSLLQGTMPRLREKDRGSL